MNKAGFHQRLHEWYAAHGRKDLPWRNTPDPYAIYLSEIMLQQTQVATVLSRYYFPFLARFPSLNALAAASQEEVLQAWQGLGYYNRALNLHKAAKISGGALPLSVDELLALPGIGRNTAHAVAAFAGRVPVAILEANVKRVVARIFALETPGDKELWAKAASLLDPANPFDYNQAMMDLGALICTPRTPDCPNCPANLICQGQSAPESYPTPKAKKAPPVRNRHIAVLRNRDGKFHATPRQTRFLNGLYHFTETDTPPVQGRLLGHIRQQYSHFTLEADVWLVEAAGSSADWYDPETLHALPMSMAEKKILGLLP